MRKAIVVVHLISPTGYYGAERWVVAQARHLDSARVEVHIAATREKGDSRPEILDRAESLGLPAHEIPLRGRFDPSAPRRTAALAAHLEADILHGHGYKSDLLAVLARRRHRCRVVATPHGFERADRLKLKFYLGAGRWALRRCDAVAPLSTELREQVERMGVDPKRIHLIENGVDLEEIDRTLETAASPAVPESPGSIDPARPATPETADPGAPPEHAGTVAYVGRLVPLKNLESMLRAFDRLCARHRQARLLLIGEGPQRAELEALAASLPSARGRVEFLGYREDRLQLLRTCALFTLSSRLEGIPRSMMEAMALGLPAVAYDIPGVDRLLRNGETGLSVPLDDTEGLADAYHRILSAPDLRNRLGRQAREHVRTHFSAQRVARDYEELYRKLIERDD